MRLQESRRAPISNGLLANPAAAPALLLWMQGGGNSASLPADDTGCARAGLRAATLAAAVLLGGYALASMPPPVKTTDASQMVLKMFSIEKQEAAERQILRLTRSSDSAFDRGKDLGEGFSDMPPVIVLDEPILDASLSSLPPFAEEHIAAESPPAALQPKFAQEFWRTIGHARLSDAYAEYLGRYSSRSAEQSPALDVDLAALARIDAEETRRLDARRMEASLHVSLLEVPIPKRAPRAAAHGRKRGSAKTGRGCRNRIWRCGPSIAPVAQGSVHRLRSRPN